MTKREEREQACEAFSMRPDIATHRRALRAARDLAKQWLATVTDENRPAATVALLEAQSAYDHWLLYERDERVKILSADDGKDDPIMQDILRRLPTHMYNQKPTP
jgi:hypothetical protein